MLKIIKERQWGFIGHIMRSQQLENISLTGKIEGKRTRGRPRKKVVDGLVEAVGPGHTAAKVLQRWYNWQTTECNGVQWRPTFK